MLSNTIKNNIINAITGRAQNVSLAPTAYLALSTTDPATSVTEPSGNGYARVLIGNYQQPLTQVMGAAANGQATNVAEIKFNEATGSWGTCTHGVIYDAATGGNIIAWGALQASLAPVANTVPLVKIGNLVISFT